MWAELLITLLDYSSMIQLHVKGMAEAWNHWRLQYNFHYFPDPCTCFEHSYLLLIACFWSMRKLLEKFCACISLPNYGLKSFYLWLLKKVNYSWELQLGFHWWHFNVVRNAWDLQSSLITPFDFISSIPIVLWAKGPAVKTGRKKKMRAELFSVFLAFLHEKVWWLESLGSESTFSRHWFPGKTHSLINICYVAYR